jgi:alkylation response protein AidB-like acyl-CoA dehydrogenase
MYTPPIDDILDVLENVVGFDDMLARADFPDVEMQTVRQILQSGETFVRTSISPYAAELDEQGCSMKDGRVVTPERFKSIWRAYVDGGWITLSLSRDIGGLGFPAIVQAAFSEMVCGASIAVSMLPLTVRGAAEVISKAGTEECKTKYLTNLVDGRWGGTIVMTEPEAGSDVGAAQTRAVQRDDGTWSISGTKMFITFGDQDLTEGIVHIAIARTGGNGPGGLSLFAVPVNHAAVRDNSVSVSRIEHKMGLMASPTCVLNFDNATGHLLGNLNEGLRTIFIMVNGMRLEVAIQGVGIASAASQAAARYAQTRIQGHHNGKPACIAQHPDVRRNLLTMRTMTEAARVLVYEAALQVDLSRHAKSPEERKAAAEMAAFLLPVCKAGCSDLSVEATGLAIQVHGGHGYIRDLGVERLYRDARILPIYEGANGIQAIDLITRKHAPNGGAVFDRLIARMRADLLLAQDAGLPTAQVKAVGAAIADCQHFSKWILEKVERDQTEALAAATPFLGAVYRVALAWSWTRMVSRSRKDHALQRTLAEFYIDQILPQAAALSASAMTPSHSWTDLPNEALV